MNRLILILTLLSGFTFNQIIPFNAYIDSHNDVLLTDYAGDLETAVSDIGVT